MVGFRLDGLTKSFGGARARWTACRWRSRTARSCASRAVRLRQDHGAAASGGPRAADGGTITIGDRVVAGPAPSSNPRIDGLGMVFQSYALWPHMSVAGNVSFALHGKGLSAAEIATRTGEALALVGLGTGRAAARPHQLSGGQSSASRWPAASRCAPSSSSSTSRSPISTRRCARGSPRSSAACTPRRAPPSSSSPRPGGSAGTRHDDRGAGERRLQQCAAPEELWRRPASPAVARFIGDGRSCRSTSSAARAAAWRWRSVRRASSCPATRPRVPAGSAFAARASP